MLKSKFLTVFVILFTGASSFSQSSNVCTANYHSDANYIKAALEVEEVSDSITISKIEWTRNSSTQGTVNLTLDGKGTSIKVEQSCETGKLIAEVQSPEADTSHFVCVEWVDCMPTIGFDNSESLCREDYFEWAKTNCEVQPQPAY